jgi:hypothetical protein
MADPDEGRTQAGRLSPGGTVPALARILVNRSGQYTGTILIEKTGRPEHSSNIVDTTRQA